MLSPFPLLLGFCPDDVKPQETKTLFSCWCAQEWLWLPSLAHVRSEDDQIMSNTSRLQGTWETPCSWCSLAPVTPTGTVCPDGLQGKPVLLGQLLSGPHSAPEGRAHLMGRPGFRRRSHTPQELICHSLI